MKEADINHVVKLIYELGLEPESRHKTMCKLAWQMDAGFCIICPAGAGETLAFYASESALKLPTVKSRLRAEFEKTGTDRQTALVRLMTALPAVREPG